MPSSWRRRAGTVPGAYLPYREGYVTEADLNADMTAEFMEMQQTMGEAESLRRDRELLQVLRRAGIEERHIRHLFGADMALLEEAEKREEMGTIGTDGTHRSADVYNEGAAAGS